jgi:hypothetical protein
MVKAQKRERPMHISDRKTDKARLSSPIQLNLIAVNHCIPGILSKCGARRSWAEQRHCKFAVKSDFANKCMHFNVYMDGHCDSIEAQKDAVILLEDLYR